MNEEEIRQLQDYLEYGIRARRVLPDGRELYVQQMTFGKGRLHIGNAQFPLLVDAAY